MREWEKEEVRKREREEKEKRGGGGGGGGGGGQAGRRAARTCRARACRAEPSRASGERVNERVGLPLGGARRPAGVAMSARVAVVRPAPSAEPCPYGGRVPAAGSCAEPSRVYDGI